MATSDALSRLLARTVPGDYQVGDLGPGDTSRLSIESFVAAVLGSAREVASQGHLRLHGEGVVGHSVDLADVGQIATTWQKAVTAVGAALENFKNLRGRLPEDTITRTTLVLSAAPYPGSVVLQIKPREDPFAEVAPDGTVPMVGAPRPLADRASEALIGWLGDATTVQADSLEPLSSSMMELGPRVGGALVSLSTALERSNVTLDASWREPEQPTRRVQITPSAAEWIKRFVAGRDLDAAEETLVGKLKTISDSQSWLVEVDGENRRMDATELQPSVVSALHIGQRVELRVRTAFREQPDGVTRTTHRLLGVSEATLDSAESGD